MKNRFVQVKQIMLRQIQTALASQADVLTVEQANDE